MSKVIDTDLQLLGSWTTSAIPNRKSAGLDHEHLGIKGPMM